jgi:DNA-3-methyladenine glycosylase
LIKAIEPVEGMETMLKNRNVKNPQDLTSGPRKLTKALAITKDLNGTDVTKRNSKVALLENKKEDLEVSSSHRIGVKIDLPQELRFFVKGNKFVSKLP